MVGDLVSRLTVADGADARKPVTRRVEGTGAAVRQAAFPVQTSRTVWQTIYHWFGSKHWIAEGKMTPLLEKCVANPTASEISVSVMWTFYIKSIYIVSDNNMYIFYLFTSVDSIPNSFILYKYTDTGDEHKKFTIWANLCRRSRPCSRGHRGGSARYPSYTHQNSGPGTASRNPGRTDRYRKLWQKTLQQCYTTYTNDVFFTEKQQQRDSQNVWMVCFHKI